MKFLLDEPQFSPQRVPEVSTSALSEEYAQEGSTSAVEASTAQNSASKLTSSLDWLAAEKAILPRLVESDPTGLLASRPGAKLDKGKVDIWSGAIDYFPRALEAIARVSEVGARKYSWKGWEKVPDGFRRYTAALMRHIVKESREEIDADTGLLHAEQTAWNAMARLELKLRDKEKEGHYGLIT